MGTYGHHTQFSVAQFFVSTLLSKIFDVGDCEYRVLKTAQQNGPSLIS